MSSAFPNMIPNEPPPLDSLDDDEDETGEECYGDFTATGLKLDILAEASPMSSPQRKLPVAHPENVYSEDRRTLTANGTGTPGNIDVDTEFQCEEKIITPNSYSNHLALNDCSPVKVVKSSDSGTSTYEEQDDFGDFHSSEFGTVLSDTNATIFNSLILPVSDTFSSSPTDDNSVQTNGIEIDQGSPVDTKEIVLIVTKCKDNLEEEAIPTAFREPVSPTTELESDDCDNFQNETVEEKVLDFSPVVESEDEFGDFSNAMASVQENMSSISPSVELEDDEFGDFSSEVQVFEKFSREVSSPPFTKLDEDFQDFPTETVSASEISYLYDQTELENDDDDFGDFHCSNLNDISRLAASEPVVIVNKSLPPPLRTTFVGLSTSPEFGEMSAAPTWTNTQDERDLIYPSQFFQTTHSTAATSTTAVNQTSDEDFGDFLSSEQNDQPSVTFTRKDSQVETRFDSLVFSVFEKPSTTEAISFNTLGLRPIDKELDAKSNFAWTQIQDFEGSHGLKFKWLNSIAHRQLLKSLKMDSSTILYSGRWGTIEVPKFAASLGDIPLQPLQPEASYKPSMSDFQEFQSHKTITNTVNPDENHHGSSSQNKIKETKISGETLAQLSDLSYTSTRPENLVFPSTPMFHD